MKIEEIRTTWLSVPVKEPFADATHKASSVIEWILVDLVTDEGITGRSHMLTFDYAPELLRGIVEKELKKRVLGQNPLYIKKIQEACWTQTEYVGQTGIAAWGMAAVDIALWDILGQHLKCPVYQLLGAYRDRVPIYGSGGWLTYSTDRLLEEVTTYVNRGFKAVKIKVGSPNPKHDIERVKAVRSAIGDDILLMVDANQGWNPHEAIALTKKIQDFDIFWLEEPVSKDDVQGCARVAAGIDIPIAAGEREYSISKLGELMAKNAVAIVQPDVLRIGGITQAVKLAHLAETYNLRVASHFYKEIDVHVLASARNGLYLEYFPWLDDLLLHPLKIVQGMAVAPELPGLSLELKPEAIKEYQVGAAVSTSVKSA